MKHFTPTCALLQCLAVAALLAGPAIAQDGGLPLPEAKPAGAPTEPTAVESSNAFAFDLYRKVIKEGENTLFSPYSISAALGMTYAGSAGETREQIRRVMHFAQNEDAVHEGFGELQGKLQSAPSCASGAEQGTGGISGQLTGEAGGEAEAADCKDEDAGATLRIANQLFPQEGFPIEPSFAERVRDAYKAPLSPLDFEADPTGSKDTINAWVSDQTEGMIPELLASLNSTTKLVLVNAIYFKGSWLSAFDEDETRDLPFTLADGSVVMTPTMKREKAKLKLGFDPDTKTRLVEIPFKGSESMIVLLPGWDSTLADVEAKLSPEFVEGMLASAVEREDDLYFPKFKVEAEFQLAGALQDLGMVDAFSEADADFSRLADAPGLHVSKVVHKAVANFDEKGAEAAAATAVVVVLESMAMGTQINRPFVYLIRNTETGAILFMGRMVDPSK